jgi:broad specificity phosphatase PhoE
MPRIYLIRHGKPASTWGESEDDPGLDAVGLAQADAVRDALLALPPALRPMAVVSSPLRSCLETAAPTAKALGVAIEMDAGVGEIPTPPGLPPAERRDWLQRAFRGGWGEIEGGLDYPAWRASVVSALNGRERTAVFTHFVAINAVVSHLIQDERVVTFHPDHVSVTALDRQDGRLDLVTRGREAETRVL